MELYKGQKPTFCHVLFQPCVGLAPHLGGNVGVITSLTDLRMNDLGSGKYFQRGLAHLSPERGHADGLETPQLHQETTPLSVPTNYHCHDPLGNPPGSHLRLTELLWGHLEELPGGVASGVSNRSSNDDEGLWGPVPTTSQAPSHSTPPEDGPQVSAPPTQAVHTGSPHAFALLSSTSCLCHRHRYYSLDT